jgi:hypothetical protein
MTGKREITGTIDDATLPRTPIVLRGKEYNLCFTIAALSEAEITINAERERAKLPERVNLLAAMTELNLRNVVVLFAAALRTFHPEISFNDAMELPQFGTDIFRVLAAIEAAWIAATPPAEKSADPPEPGPETGPGRDSEP